MSKKTIITKSSSKRFGLFSVIALVAGIVIGSGIFQKNESILGGTGNQMDAIYAWIAGTILVLATVLAFIEVFSISNKANKPGTLFYWSKNLIGPKTGKTLAIIAVFIYVGMSIAALPLWASNKMLSASGLQFVDQINDAGIIVSEANISQWGYFFSNWGIGLIFMAVIYGITVMSRSGQKAVSNVGMGIKLIPLVFVIITSIVVIGMGDKTPISSEPIEGVTPTYGDNSFLNILSVLPAILFTYNGFITSASIMNESKSQRTYKMGYISGMGLVATIYILYTISTFWLGGTGLQDAITGTFPEHGKWISAIMQGAVVISMLSGMMGTASTGPKHYANMSADGLFRDKEGKLLRRNRELMPQYSAWQLLGIALVYQFVFMSLDMIAIGSGMEFAKGQYMIALNFATDFAAIFVFFAYAVIISATLWNRKTGKVEVDKSKFFIPSAIISVLGISVVMGFQLYDTMFLLITDANFVKIIVFVILAASPFVVLWWNNKKVSMMTETEWNKKKEYARVYDSLSVSEEFIDGAKPFLFK